jgi:tRNA-modifying protein YgfZ
MVELTCYSSTLIRYSANSMVALPPLPDYLSARGARPGPAGVFDFGDPEREWHAAAAAAVVADASSLGMLEFEGADTADFLQGQLSNDVDALAPGQGQWTTYNSPKGRMLATLFLLRDPDRGLYAALLARDLVEAIRKRLSMFVLRSKVALRDASGHRSLLGVGGPGAAEAVQRAFGAAPGAGQVANSASTLVVHWPDGRFIVPASEAAAPGVFDALAQDATPAGAPIWGWLGVRSGVPMITAATQDRFVAQAANWDVLGGLSFRKGCYTGQEIVARTQHLGRLKERLFSFRAGIEPPAPGTRLYAAAFGDQASGTVVNSASDPAGGSRFLAVAQIDAANVGTMAIGAPGGPQARREPLPYDVPAPTQPRGRVGA